MRITGIGIDEDVSYSNGDLSHLQKNLAFFAACGFDNVELTVHRLGVIINGRLRQRQVEKIQRITEKFPFVYTVHAPLRLNLAFPQRWPGNPTDLAHERNVFIANLDFCAAIGAKVMVYHSGLIALHQAAFGLSPLPTDDELEQGRAQEVNALQDLMPLAAERGLVVAMENRDPHPWEAATLIQAGLPPDLLLKYHAGMSMSDLVRQIKAVNHSNLGITLDFAHLFLAANYCGFNYLEAIREAAPYIRHLHASDNFGRLGGVFSSLSDRIPYGDGDVHLPPGWGEIPYVDALSQLSEYEGLYVLELPSHFHNDLPEILETVQQTIHDATE